MQKVRFRAFAQRTDSQRLKTGRPAARSIHQARIRDRSEDSEISRHDDFADAPRADEIIG